MSGDLEQLQRQVRSDRRLIQRAERALAEIDRGAGLSDEHADVLAALRIRLEGKERASLDELLSAAGEIRSRRELGDVLEGGGERTSADWPTVEEEKRDWPGL